MKSFIVLSLSALSAAAQIWIAPGPTNAGTGIINGNGTQADPYCGDMDAVLSNTPSSSEVVFLPGVFWTQATPGWGNLKSYQRIRGSGRGITTIVRDRSFGTNVAHVIFQTYGNYVSISDLTLDCNATGLETNGCSGAGLLGNNETFERVQVINPSGCQATGSECFALFMEDVTGPRDRSHNLALECEVSQVKGDYVDGISIFSQGVISHCNVILPAITNGNVPFQFYNAYGLGHGSGLMLLDSQSSGGTSFFYEDSWWDTNVVVSGNVAVDCWAGVRFMKKSTGIDGLYIRNNCFTLSAVQSAGIALDGAFINNVDICDNSIRLPGDLGGVGRLGIIVQRPVANLKVTGNTLSPGMAIKTSTNCLYSNNTDTLGNSVRKQSL